MGEEGVLLLFPCTLAHTSFRLSPPSLTLAKQRFKQKKNTMPSSEYADRQRFKSEDGTPLASLRSHPCGGETGERYVLWTDIQRAFQGISRLETEFRNRTLFTVEAGGELYVLLSGMNVYCICCQPSKFTNG